MIYADLFSADIGMVQRLYSINDRGWTGQERGSIELLK